MIPFVVNNLSVWWMHINLKMCLLCFALHLKQNHLYFWPTHAWLLSLTSRVKLGSYSNEIDKDWTRFHFGDYKTTQCFVFGHYTSWVMRLSILTSFITKLKAGPRGTRTLSRSSIHHPLLEKKDDYTVSWEEFCFSGEEKRQRSSSADWRTYHNAQYIAEYGAGGAFLFSPKSIGFFL